MPGTMFQEVVCPRADANRKWYTLPLSFAIHTAVVAMLIVVPLVATDVLPSPRVMLQPYVDIAVPPVQPVAQPPRQAQPRPEPATNPGIAPTEAPSGIGIETALDLREADVQGTPNGLLDGFAGVPLALDVAPPAPPPTPTVVRPGGLIRPPERIKDVAPRYPEIARVNHVDGVVIIEARIGINGKVEDARVMRSIKLLDNAALDAVRGWEYTPTLLNGQPVAVVMTVTVHFRLN